MRDRIISFFKENPKIILFIYSVARYLMRLWSIVVPVQKKTIIFNSFGGRRFDDSPKAIYDEICKRKEFDNWRLIWAFVNPDEFIIPRGEKVKIDTYSFFKALLYSQVWVGNTGVDRGIDLKMRRNIRIETWHGTPLKKICGDENSETFAVKPESYTGPIDNDTIRCAQSVYDRDIFQRLFHASMESFLMCDLPRNDQLFRYTHKDITSIKQKLNILDNKKVILYTPTYREYLINKGHQTYIAPPIDLNKWEEKLGHQYVLLIRAHYAVSAALNIATSDFVKDVSGYPVLNDLYAISDLMISDYSSTFFDYSILDRPMLCFAYDRAEYEEKRGLYLDLESTLPCEIDYDEDSLLRRIKKLDYKAYSQRAKEFHKKFTPNAGNASIAVVDELQKRLKKKKRYGKSEI